MKGGMSILSEDLLIRQIQRLVRAIARLIRGDSQEAEPVEAECEAAAGLGIDTALNLPLEGVLALMSDRAGLDADRTMALGLGLLARGASLPEGAERARAQARGAELILAAVETRPALLLDDVRQIIAELAAPANPAP